MKRYLFLLAPIIVLMLYLVYPNGISYPQAKLTKPDYIKVEYQGEALDFYPADYYYQEFYKSIKKTWQVGSAAYPTYIQMIWEDDFEDMVVKFIYNDPILYIGGHYEDYRETTISGYMFSYEKSGYIPIEADYTESRLVLEYRFDRRFENTLNKLKGEFE